MQLPLAEEIREARRRAEEASRASSDLHAVEIALISVTAIERQLGGMGPSPRVDLPGEPVIERLSDTWPALSDLRAGGPADGQPLPVRLAARRAQLETARQVLAPLAAELAAAITHLSRLQHEQRHHLEDPRYADECRALTELGQERDQLVTRMQPVRQQLAMVAPVTRLLVTFGERLSSEAASAAVDRDPRGAVAWRAASLADSLVQSLASVLANSGLEVPLPALIDLPPSPDPAESERLRAELDRVRDALRPLAAALDRENQRLSDEVAAMTARFDEVTRQILDQMG